MEQARAARRSDGGSASSLSSERRAARRSAELRAALARARSAAARARARRSRRCAPDRRRRATPSRCAARVDRARLAVRHPSRLLRAGARGGRADKLAAVNFRRLGSSDLEVSEISLGSWLTYSGGVEREQAEACVRRGVRGRHQLHRHGQRLRSRRRRVAARRGARADTSAPPTCSRRRSTSRCPTPTGACRRRRSTSRSTPRWSACERTTSTSTSATATTSTRRWRRRWARSPKSSRAGKARHIGFSEWPVQRVEAVARAAGRRAVGLQPAAVLDAVARARGRADPAVRTRADLPDRVVAARPGRADRQVPPGQRRRRRTRARPARA